MAELIDRQELIKDICGYCAVNSHCDYVNKGGCYDTQLVVEQPTVEERKHGKWEKWTSNEELMYPMYHCNLCGNLTNVFAITPYCSKCGAKMDGDNDG